MLQKEEKGGLVTDDRAPAMLPMYQDALYIEVNWPRCEKDGRMQITLAILWLSKKKTRGEVNTLYRTDLRRVSQLRDEERTSVRRKCEAEANYQKKISTDRFKLRIVPKLTH